MIVLKNLILEQRLFHESNVFGFAQNSPALKFHLCHDPGGNARSCGGESIEKLWAGLEGADMARVWSKLAQEKQGQGVNLI